MIARLALVPAVAAALAAPPPTDQLAFSPAEARILTRRFDEATSWALDSLEMTLDGGPMEQDLPDVEVTHERSLEVTDEYVTVEEGRVTALLRTFEALSARVEMSAAMGGDGEERELALASELEGEVVRFDHDADTGEWKRRFDEGEGDEALLAGLTYDLDLDALLPDDDVTVDATWDVPIEALRPLLVAGGDLSLRVTDLDEGGFMMLEDRSVLAATSMGIAPLTETLEGTVQATYEGFHEDEDGRRLARIGIAVEVAGRADRSAALAQHAEALGRDELAEDVELEASFDADGEGVVLWDVEGGRLASIELVLDASIAVRLAWVERLFEGDGLRIEGRYEASGTSELRAAVE